MHAAIFTAGGDYPGDEFIVGSAADALLCCYKSGRRKLSADDQLTLEFAGVSRRYHAAIMRTHVVGRPKPQPLHAAARAALLACQAELHPGWTAGEMFAANARVFDAHRLARHKLNACGYFAGREVYAVVDGSADVLGAQRLRHRGGAALFPPHDCDGQRQLRRDVPRRRRSHRRSLYRTFERGRSGPGGQIGLAER